MASHGVPLAGGDLSRAAALTVSVTAVGRAEHPVLRSGGRAGDRLVVTGSLGAQAASGFTAEVTPRLCEGRQLAAIATAMIDLSDGIARDCGRLARASGCGARIDLERLPLAAGATLEQAAAAGEDYELLAALPDTQPQPSSVTDVGRADRRRGRAAARRVRAAPRPGRLGPLPVTGVLGGLLAALMWGTLHSDRVALDAHDRLPAGAGLRGADGPRA